MRTEQEMMDVILNTAKEDERIRAVYLNGSRTNPGVVKDKYRDFDVVYVVRETETFVKNPDWIQVFGHPAIVQEPDSNDLGWGIHADLTKRYAWLILFDDWNRMDLTIVTVEAMKEEYGKDSLTQPLLDKDHILESIPDSNDQSYWIQKPTIQQYHGCCNEFWWCLNNVAKGIVRDQLSYVMRMYTQIVHVELEKMLTWYIGTEHDFMLSCGMWGKYFKKLLPAYLFEQYQKTYSTADYDTLWNAIDNACELFHTTALLVGEKLHFPYQKEEEKGMRNYLEYMKKEYRM